MTTPIATTSRAYPFSHARSTGTTNTALLASLLAVDTLDEISNIEDFAGVESYIRNTGRVDADTSTTQTGIMFWLYPTGLHGPYHTTEEDGEVQRHGTLITIERGVRLEEAVQMARRSLNTTGVGHVHIRAS